MKTTPRTKKKPTRSSLVKKLDSVFSLYIRQRNKDSRGFTECVTCGKKDHYKKLQAGHFISRKNYSTRWDEDNVQVQCVACNVYRYGEQYKFSLWLNKMLGEGTADRLHAKGLELVKFSNFELQDMIDMYKDKLKRFS